MEEELLTTYFGRWVFWELLCAIAAFNILLGVHKVYWAGFLLMFKVSGLKVLELPLCMVCKTN